MSDRLPRILNGAKSMRIIPPSTWRDRWSSHLPHRPPGDEYLLVLDESAHLGFVVWVHRGDDTKPWRMRGIDPTLVRCLLVLGGIVDDVKPTVERRP